MRIYHQPLDRNLNADARCIRPGEIMDDANDVGLLERSTSRVGPRATPIKRPLRNLSFAGMILSCAWLLAFPATTNAALVGLESIEWVVADSDRVITGKIVNVDKAMNGAEVVEVVTVEVLKTIKGDHAPRVTFVMQSLLQPLAERWFAKGAPMLFCLVNRNRVDKNVPLPKGVEWGLRNHTGHSAVLLTPVRRSEHVAGEDRLQTLGVVTSDCNVIEDVDAILKAVEEAARAFPAGTEWKSVILDLPEDTPAFERYYSGSSVWLTVPVDAKLEMLARAWCRHESWQVRCHAAALLRHFKSEQNIEILRTLLRDPRSYIEHRYVAGPNNTIRVSYLPAPSDPPPLSRKRIYPVRNVAYKVLQEFGVEVDPSVLEGPLEEAVVPPVSGESEDEVPHSVRFLGVDWRVCIALVALAALLLVVFARRQARRKRCSPNGI
jgi:hypothetical protein